MRKTKKESILTLLIIIFNMSQLIVPVRHLNPNLNNPSEKKMRLPHPCGNRGDWSPQLQSACVFTHGDGLGSVSPPHHNASPVSPYFIFSQLSKEHRVVGIDGKTVGYGTRKNWVLPGGSAT